MRLASAFVRSPLIISVPFNPSASHNVLEATVVHDVDEDGAAKQAGLVADVLVVSVNGETTRGLLHDEVITLLRTPDRPLTLKVQDLDAVTLARRRKEARGLALAARQPPTSTQVRSRPPSWKVRYAL